MQHVRTVAAKVATILPRMKGAAMKAMTSVATDGLVPVPPMPDSQSRTDKEVTERMATNDELERIRRELEDLNAEWRADHGNASGAGSGAFLKQRIGARSRLGAAPKVGRRTGSRGSAIAALRSRADRAAGP
jgi:hypothetical protein